MHLLPEDFSSPCWKRLTQTLTARLQELRELNDSASFDPIKTSALRGSIAEVKKILSLADEVSDRPATVPGFAGVGDPMGDQPEM